MNKRSRFIFLVAFTAFMGIRQPVSFAQAIADGPATRWVDSVFTSLTPDQRIAQLLMLRAYSNRDTAYVSALGRLVRDLNPGGVCFFQGGPVRQANVTNVLQSESRVPMFVALDAEWGPGMRLDSVDWFPKQMTLGAIRDDSLIYRMGETVAAQLTRLGVQINFAPVSDVNNNPLNPVINARSFGEDPQNVARKAYCYMKGMQDKGLIAVAKHFPGHGDTGSDSHLTLPVVDKSRAELDSVELYPFKQLIKGGVHGVMVAHLSVPALDTVMPVASLSGAVINGLLRQELGFSGLVITDGMDMKGLTGFSDPGMVEADALKAGNDILLLPVDAARAIQNIRNACDSGIISETLINEKCRKVLAWKYACGLNRYKPVITEGLAADINPAGARLVTRAADAEAITLIHDRNSEIPVRALDTLRMASLVIGDTLITPFQQMLSAYAPVDHFNLPKEPDPRQTDSIRQLLMPYNRVVAAFVKTSDLPQKNFGINPAAAAFIDSLALSKPLTLCIFTSPYAVASFPHTAEMHSVFVSYQDNAVMQELTAQAVFGGIPVHGRLPVTAGPAYPAGCGLDRDQVIRFSFGIPEEAGLDSEKLAEIDSIALQGIAEGAYPGAQLLVARNGKVVYRKSFGNQTYAGGARVSNDDLYDLASLTKVLATTLVAMKLTGDGVINPDHRLSHYMKSLRRSNKASLTIREIMAHQAGLQPFIPFYMKLLSDYAQDTTVVARAFSDDYPVRVAADYYIGNKWPAFIVDSITASPLLKKKEYKYSDLGFILLGRTFETLTCEPLDTYLDHTFYKKLGLSTLGYRPLDRTGIQRIAPTENDTTFRKQLIHGYVHDPAAAMLGGVAGHAGLFSDALDVAIVMQMILQNGSYGGQQFLDPGVINDFTRVQFPQNGNRRGAGFDRPADPREPGPTCREASARSFGHSGFTGTYTWVDPAEGLVYVFLSNRIYPDAGNSLLARDNIRTRIQEVIYRSVILKNPEVIHFQPGI